MTFEEFIGSPRLRSHWITDERNGVTLAIYVRRSHPARGTNFDIANITASERGTGAFTAFLDQYEPQYQLFIECVVNERLRGFLERRGYRKLALDWDNEIAPCYIKPEQFGGHYAPHPTIHPARLVL